MKSKCLLFVMLLVMVLSFCGCGKVQFNETHIQTAVDYFLNSGNNPLAQKYITSDYEVLSSEITDTSASAQIRIVQESAKTHYEVTVVARYQIQDKDIHFRSCHAQDDVIYYPIQGLDAEAYRTAEEMINLRFGNITNHEIKPINWEDKDNHFTAQVKIQTEYETYIDTVQGECELYWDLWNEEWYCDRTFTETNHEIDFSPLNGIWSAKYTHNSNYMTENNIPYTFTFSNAGTIQIKDGIKSTSTVTVEHGLNEIWDKYLNPKNIDVVPNGTNYESGTMEIVYEDSGGYFLITFDETNVEKIFDSSCQLRIDSRQIIFYDALVAKNCRLSKG